MLRCDGRERASNGSFAAMAAGIGASPHPARPRPSTASGERLGCNRGRLPRLAAPIALADQNRAAGHWVVDADGFVREMTGDFPVGLAASAMRSRERKRSPRRRPTMPVRLEPRQIPTFSAARPDNARLVDPRPARCSSDRSTWGVDTVQRLCEVFAFSQADKLAVLPSERWLPAGRARRGRGQAAERNAAGQPHVLPRGEWRKENCGEHARSSGKPRLGLSHGSIVRLVRTENPTGSLVRPPGCGPDASRIAAQPQPSVAMVRSKSLEVLCLRLAEYRADLGCGQSSARRRAFAPRPPRLRPPLSATATSASARLKLNISQSNVCIRRHLAVDGAAG